jgi:hypothetical protein
MIESLASQVSTLIGGEIFPYAVLVGFFLLFLIVMVIRNGHSGEIYTNKSNRNLR